MTLAGSNCLGELGRAAPGMNEKFYMRPRLAVGRLS
jgi:hypothetical protein